MSIRFPVGLFVLSCFCNPALAQTHTTPPVPDPITVPPAANKDPYTTQQHDLMKLYGHGLYQQVIDKATTSLKKADKPDPFLLYWRGFARRRLSLFEDARTDLSGLGNYSGWPKFPAASAMVKELDTLIALRPPNEYDIHNGDKVIFRVYYGDDSELSNGVIKALPQGYLAASRFTDAQTQDVPVFLFDANKYQDFFRFYTLLRGSAPRVWWQLLSNSGSITISRLDGNGHSFSLQGIVRSLSHEMTHQFMYRKIGSPRDFPNWFNEGAARCAEATVVPTMRAQNDQQIRRLLAQNALLPLAQIANSISFHDAMTKTLAGTGQTNAYAQGFNMTRYLGVLLKGETMGSFLNALRDKGGFTAALKDRTGLTPDQFYKSWLSAISPSKS